VPGPACIARGGSEGAWSVGYDPSSGEPNDGYVSAGDSQLFVESKLVPQFWQAVLEDILQTYRKYERWGEGYGHQRVLVILTNAGDGRTIKISALRDQIKDSSPFDRVLHAGAVSTKEGGAIVIFHIFQAYPTIEEKSSALAQVELDLRRGVATVPYQSIDWGSPR
jgi:hypothetical protein